MPYRPLRASLLSTCAVLLALLLATGCDSALDLDPSQSIEEETALSSPQNVQAALVGAYNVLGDDDLYGGQLQMSADLLADDGEVNWDGTFSQPADFWNKTLFANNSFVEDQWIEAYEVINVANNVLSALDVFEDEAVRQRVEGEARFIRGLMYFELVRVFAEPWSAGDPTSSPGVPLVLEPTRTIDEASAVARSTMAEVYDQALADLTAARDLLPEANGIYADTYAASAVLSRVYLTQGAYEQAAEAASRVIASGLFELAPTFAEAFNNVENISEYIFAIEVTPQDGTNQLNNFYGSDENGGRGDIDITEDHLARYQEGDARGAFFYTDAEGAVRTTKWEDDEADGANIPVIRLAEMYLTRAEANLRAGTTIGAAPVEDVNAVRNRAGLEDLSSVTVEEVLRERELELMFEGQLLHDLQRTGRGVGSIPYDADRLVYPIPQRELDANPNLTQNPGYGS